MLSDRGSFFFQDWTAKVTTLSPLSIISGARRLPSYKREESLHYYKKAETAFPTSKTLTLTSVYYVVCEVVKVIFKGKAPASPPLFPSGYGEDQAIATSSGLPGSLAANLKCEPDHWPRHEANAVRFFFCLSTQYCSSQQTQKLRNSL